MSLNTKRKANREQNRRNKKLIYAIKFKDLPFPEIDKYVCVPYSWIIHRLEGQKVLVAYPKNEAPFVTRNRTKNRYKYSSKWRFYIGFIKFESEYYHLVVDWIEKMIAEGGDDQEEESEVQDFPAERVGSRQLRSAKTPILSGALPERPHLAVKPYDNARRPLPRMLIRRPLPLRPWKPKPIQPSKPAVSSANAPSKDQSVIVEHHQIQNAVKNRCEQESVDTSIQSPSQLPDDRQPLPNPEDGRQPSPVQDEQLPDIDDSDVEVEIVVESVEEERQPSSEQAQPAPVSDHHYSLIESRLHEIHNGPQQANDTLKTLLVQNSQPPSRANQPYDYAHMPVSTPSSKPQLQGTIGSSSEVTHSYQNSHFQGLVKTIPSTTYCTPTAIDLSPQRQIPAIKRKSSTAIRKPVEKEPRVDITKNIPTSQQSLYNKQPQNYASNVGDQRHLQSMNTSAAQNLSQLAHQARFYEPSQLQYLQQIARMQEMINWSSMPYIDQRSYLPNPMTGYVPHQPNQINTSQFLQRQNQPQLVITNQMSELMRYVTAPSVAALQRQDPLVCKDPHTVKPLEPQSNPTPQATEEVPIASPETHQQLSNDRRNISRNDLLAKLSLGPTSCIDICADSATCLDSETQTTSESQETPTKVSEKNLYQHPESKKLMADQATEMESDEHHFDGIQSPLELIESGYETDKHPTKEQESEEVSDSEMVSADEELSDNVSTDGSDCANEDYSDEDTLASISNERSMDARNLMQEVQEKISTMAEEELLEVHGLLLTKMYKNFVITEEHYNNLRVSTLGCLKLYETILNKVKKVNVIESHTNPTSEAPELSQAQEKPASAPEQNSISDQNKNSSVKNLPKKSKPRHTFVFPPEYDPNDSRWTLKHRNPGPKLKELMPRSRVYVNINEYNKCIRSSNDCRTLARSLLTAVFSKNALSICSPTGAKARAFKDVEIDVRPGLDEDSRLALLAFIDKYGKERKWNTSDTAGIMSSIRTKIHDMRRKYGKTKVV